MHLLPKDGFVSTSFQHFSMDLPMGFPIHGTVPPQEMVNVINPVQAVLDLDALSDLWEGGAEFWAAFWAGKGGGLISEPQHSYGNGGAP